MSYDFYIWPSGVTVDPVGLAEQLADEEASDMERDNRVLAFRAELLRRWPELADMISPWHRDLGWRQPWGRVDLADRFVCVALPFGWENTDELPDVARQHGLDCYDPQFDELHRP